MKRIKDISKKILVYLLVATMLLGTFGLDAAASEIPAANAEGVIQEEEPAPVQEEEETPAAAVETQQPVQETPTQDTPVQDTPVQETPIQQTPIQETPVQEEPAVNQKEVPSEEPAEEVKTANLETHIKQSVFQEEKDGKQAACIRYEIKVTNTGNGDATEAAVKVLLRDKAAYDYRADETPELIYIEDTAKLPQGIDLNEVKAEDVKNFTGKEAVMWLNQTIPAGGGKTYVFYGRAAEGTEKTAEVENRWYVNGARVADPLKFTWENEALLKIETVEEKETKAELPDTFVYEDSEKIVTAKISDPKALPEGVKFVVKSVSKDRYEEIGKLLEEQIIDEESTEETKEELAGYVVYDMHFELDGKEVEPENANVSVSIQYKEEKKLEEADEEEKTSETEETDYAVIHIEEGDKAVDVTEEVKTTGEGGVEEAALMTKTFSEIVLMGTTRAAISTKTIFDYGGDYSIHYILNNFNIFVQNEVTAGHTVGAVAVGGNATFASGIGGLSGTMEKYPHTIPSYLAGGTANVNNYDAASTGQQLLIGRDTNVTGGYPENSCVRNSNFINFADAFNQIKAEAESYVGKEKNIKISAEDIKPGKNGTGYKITYDWSGYVITMESGYSFELEEGVISEIGRIDLMYTGEDVSAADTLIIAGDTGAVTLPYIYLNGDANTIIGESGVGCSAAFMLPYATSVKDKTPSQQHNGHVIAPNAAISNINGAANGCWIAKSLNIGNTESHMWPYKGEQIKPTTGEFKVKKTVNGVPATADQKFTFKLEQIGEIPAGSQELVDKKVQNNGENVNFGTISYNKEGAYYYKITEVGSVEGYQKNDQSFIVKVVVTSKSSQGVTTFDKEITYYRGSTVADVAEENKVTEASVTFDNIYNASGSAQISARKTLTGAVLKADQFEFTLTPETTGDTNKVQTVKNDKDGNINFTELSYTKAGTYTYELKESSTDGKGVITDKTVYKVVVTVTDNGKGKLETSVVVTDKDNKEVLGGKPVFMNTYSASGSAQISAGKTLTGASLQADQFEFTLTPKTAGDTNKAQTVKNDKDGNINFTELSYTKAGTYTYELKESSTDGKGVITDKAVYKVVVTVTDNGKGKLETSVVVTDKDNKEVLGGNPVFKNTYSASGSAQISAGKTLTGASLKADQFEFTLTPETAGDTNKTQTVKNDKDGNINFAGLSYTKAGTYEYELKESSKNGNGITVDGSVYKVTVTATDNGEGKLITKVTVTDSKGKAVDNNKPVFKNKYEASGSAQISAGKTLTGAALKADQFEFTLTPETTGDTNKAQTVKNDKDGNINFTELSYTKAGTYEYELKETSKSGNGITVDGSIYKVIVTAKDNGEGKLTTKVTVTDSKGKVVDNNKPVFKNTYSASGSAQISAGKTLTGAALKADQFEFTLTPETTGDTNKAQTVKNDKDGNINFTELSYTKAGTYEYELKETSKNGNGITVDGSVYKVNVTATDNGKGKLITKVTVTDSEGKAVNNNKPVFKNTYSASGSAQISAGKTLTGAALQAGQFEFTLTPETAGDTNKAQTVKNDKDGNISFAGLSYTKAGTYEYELKETSKSGNGITVDGSVYKATVTATDNGEGKLITKVTVMDSEGNPVDNNKPVFENKYEASGTVEFKGTKELIGREFEAGDDFTFNLYEGQKVGEKIEYADTPVDSQIISGIAGGSNAEFTFKAQTFTKPGTYYYKVMEAGAGQIIANVVYDASEYLITVEVKDEKQDGTLDVSYVITKDGTDIEEIAFANTYKKARAVIRGKKTIEGTNMTEGLFRFQLLDDSGTVIDTAKNSKDGSFEFGKLEYETAGTYTYTVKEIGGGRKIAGIAYDGSEQQVTVSVREDRASGNLTAVASTDARGALTFNNNAYTDITVEKEWQGDSEYLEDRPQQISVALLRNGEVYQTANLMADNWTHTFQNLPRKDDNGNLYIYTVKEDEVPYYQADVETIDGGFRLVNTYVNPQKAIVQLDVNKVLEGSTLRAGQFSFSLYDENGTLLETETNNENGSIAFNDLIFEKAGTYRYTIREQVGTTNYIIYDAEEVKVTVEVTEEDHMLNAAVTYTKGTANMKSGNAQFRNIYYPISLRLQKRSKDLTQDPLYNACYGLYRVNEGGRDILVESQYSDEQGYMYFSNIVPGYKYYFKEISAPSGHTVDEYRSAIFEVSWNAGATRPEDCVTVTYFDNQGNPTNKESYSAQIKMESTPSETPDEEMAAADYTFENDELVAAAWVSDPNAFPAGTTMAVEALTEGSKVHKDAAEQVESELGETKGSKYYDVHFVDANGREIEPASGTVTITLKYKENLELTEEENTGVKIIHITDDKKLEQLEGWVYKINETELKEASFTTGSLSVFALVAHGEEEEDADGLMLNAQGVADEVTKLNVAKIDKNTGAYLEGAHLQIIEESTGNVVCDWISTKGNYAVFRQLDVDTIYILREVEAPEGYGLAEDTRFIFDIYGNMTLLSGADAEWNDDTTLTLFNERKPEEKVIYKEVKNVIRKTATVKTGDEAPMAGMLILCVIAAGAILFTLARKKKNRF